jgi:hypothetical protein
MPAAVLGPVAAVTLSLALAAPPGAQTAPPRDVRAGVQAPAPVGTAQVTGAVTMAGTGQPARKTRVTLSGTEIRGTRSATTDDQGRFSFTALPAGRYSLSANRPGYLSISYGARQPGRQGTQIQLSEGQKFQANLQIPRGSVITGIVMDENGEPTPQVPVRVMRFVIQNGQRTLQNSSSASTDDRGMYRIYGLLPGEYIVCATPRNNTVADGERMVFELQALRQEMEVAGRGNPEQARALAARVSALQQMQQSMPSDGPPPGYAPICYPGSISAANATAVPVGIGEERVGIDFQLQLAPLARVEGTVLNSTGAQLRDISLNLTEVNAMGQAMPAISARADGEGRFRMNNVPPGQYRLTARANIGAPQAGGGRGGPPGQRPEPVIVWASADVVVDGRNVSNVILTLQQGVSVSGQLAFDGSIQAPADLTRFRVTMAPVGPNPFGGGASAARVDANGRFTIPSVPPGRYRLSAGASNGWFPESSMIGGQDALDFPFEVKGTQNISGAVVTFTDKQTELTGVVTNERGEPAVDYTLVAFPSDQRYWGTGTSRRIQTTRPGTDGRYTWRNLPPGDYRIAPVLDIDPGMTSDPQFLQQLEQTSLRITLQAGEKKVQDIRFGG